jgi:hypothetical protein
MTTRSRVRAPPLYYPELSEAQIAALPEEHRRAYLTLRGMDAASGRVSSLFDPDFRTALAGQWVRDNARDLRADGWDGDAVAATLADAEADHPLWVHFERVQVRGFRAVLPDPKTWGIGEATRMVAPGLELLYLHSSAVEGMCGRPVSSNGCIRSRCTSSTVSGGYAIWDRIRTPPPVGRGPVPGGRSENRSLADPSLTGPDVPELFRRSRGPRWGRPLEMYASMWLPPNVIRPVLLPGPF